MITQRNVVLNKGSTRYPAELIIDGNSIHLKSEIASVRKEGQFYFHTLKAIRAELQKEGIAILVNGSRIDVYPSGMTLSTFKAYVHTIGRQTSLNDLVNIFDEVSSIERIGSVEEQEEYHNKWVRSLGQ